MTQVRLVVEGLRQNMYRHLRRLSLEVLAGIF
jgi:hypothetical protein